MSADVILRSGIQPALIKRSWIVQGCIAEKRVALRRIVNYIQILLALAGVSCVKILLYILAGDECYIFRKHGIHPSYNVVAWDRMPDICGEAVFICVNTAVRSGAAVDFYRSIDDCRQSLLYYILYCDGIQLSLKAVIRRAFIAQEYFYVSDSRHRPFGKSEQDINNDYHIKE